MLASNWLCWNSPHFWVTVQSAFPVFETPHISVSAQYNASGCSLTLLELCQDSKSAARTPVISSPSRISIWIRSHSICEKLLRSFSQKTKTKHKMKTKTTATKKTQLFVQVPSSSSQKERSFLKIILISVMIIGIFLLLIFLIFPLQFMCPVVSEMSSECKTKYFLKNRN